MGLKIGDIVARISYGSDILFKVSGIRNEGGKRIVTLKGICYRLEADAPETDLTKQSDNYIREYNARVGNMVRKKVNYPNRAPSRSRQKKNPSYST